MTPTTGIFQKYCDSKERGYGNMNAEANCDTNERSPESISFPPVPDSQSTESTQFKFKVSCVYAHWRCIVVFLRRIVVVGFLTFF